MIRRTQFCAFQCLDRVVRFAWPFGLFCPISDFCGVGLDLNKRYPTDSVEEFVPLKEVCSIVINPNIQDCDGLKNMIYDTRAVKGQFKTINDHQLNTPPPPPPQIVNSFPDAVSKWYIFIGNACSCIFTLFPWVNNAPKFFRCSIVILTKIIQIMWPLNL